MTFDGAAAEIDGAIEKLSQVLKGASRRVIILDGSAPELDSANIWKIRGCLVKAVEAVSEQEPLDIVVPIARVADFVEYVNVLENQSGMQMISFGHAGDGNVHLCVVRGGRSEQVWESELNANLEKLYAKAKELGGLISGEHGLGVSKRSYFFAQTPAANVDLMNAIKKAFDQKGILNPEISYVK